MRTPVVVTTTATTTVCRFASANVAAQVPVATPLMMKVELGPIALAVVSVEMPAQVSDSVNAPM